jgi:hypothetical protein
VMHSANGDAKIDLPLIVGVSLIPLLMLVR